MGGKRNGTQRRRAPAAIGMIAGDNGWGGKRAPKEEGAWQEAHGGLCEQAPLQSGSEQGSRREPITGERHLNPPPVDRKLVRNTGNGEGLSGRPWNTTLWGII